MWIIFAVLSAFFAGITAVLSKSGIKNVNSNLGTAIRTIVVFIFALLMVFVAGVQTEPSSISTKTLIFLISSGFATGASWLCYYYAIQNGAVSVVVPIDKLSILVSIVFSGIFFGERLSKKAVFGLCAMLAGTVGMAVFT